MTLSIRIRQEVNKTFRASCPALPGCVVYAQSKDEAQARVRLAISGYLASLDVALPRELGLFVAEVGRRTRPVSAALPTYAHAT